jgi:hypothetical protein
LSLFTSWYSFYLFSQEANMDHWYSIRSQIQGPYVQYPPEAFYNNLLWRNPISLELDNIEKGETPESWRKTTISTEMFDKENDKLLEKSVVIGIIQ